LEVFSFFRDGNWKEWGIQKSSVLQKRFISIEICVELTHFYKIQFRKFCEVFLREFSQEKPREKSPVIRVEQRFRSINLHQSQNQWKNHPGNYVENSPNVFHQN
jgi:hypothetical protein